MTIFLELLRDPLNFYTSLYWSVAYIVPYPNLSFSFKDFPNCTTMHKISQQTLIVILCSSQAIQTVVEFLLYFE